MLPELMTIGYEGTTSAEVLALLRRSRVQLLIDVRAVASSRKPGFSKTLLAAGLQTEGIGYLHLPGLGTPKEGRQAVRAGQPHKMEAIYAEHMKSDRAQAELAHAIQLAQTDRCCLLCFERDHTTCHRRIVAEAIHSATGQPVTHLAVPV
ncbi:MAG: hypothetical protein JWR51_1419 [Devosia sp.]|uniref:DUF488 domain-containing protein n=1 Tax=Devosia sp. TaxID=1871048 RepID=UPI00262BB18A|nr:DUF488 domain-containing protein [Devosia sp.]MDB5528316.1 hypothetical protein [Devosia sp.]